jgi:hypothetical protein
MTGDDIPQVLQALQVLCLPRENLQNLENLC